MGAPCLILHTLHTRFQRDWGICLIFVTGSIVLTFPTAHDVTLEQRTIELTAPLTYAHFGNPKCARYVCPFAVGCLLERTARVWTQYARNRRFLALCVALAAWSAQPLVIWDLEDAITSLMNTNVTSVAEHHLISVLGVGTVEVEEAEIDRSRIIDRFFVFLFYLLQTSQITWSSYSMPTCFAFIFRAH